eukprot:m51a1_g12557 putative snare domain containing protein, C-tail anchored protein (269) ;mRNA; f:3031-4107
METMMRRLVQIREECNVKDSRAASQPQGKLDRFSQAKHQISAELRDIRATIKERDDQERSNPQSRHAVELSHSIRMALKHVEEEYVQMNEHQLKQEAKVNRAKEKGKKMDPELEQQLSFRADVLKMISSHIEECRSLEKRRGAAMSMAVPEKSDPTVTSLPNIDDPRFQVLLKNDAAIDDMLDRISDAVGTLHDMAKEMGNEIDKQEQMLGDLEVKVDKADAHVINLNKRLKQIIDQTRKGDKFCLDFILIVVLLGIGGVIYNFARKW